MAGFQGNFSQVGMPQSGGNGSMYGFDPSSKTYASDTFGALTRDQWATYVNTFVPVENKLIQYATDPNVVSGAMQKASTGVNAAFDQQQGATARRLGGMGVSLSGDEQAEQNKQYGLSRSLADVQAQNMAGDITRQRQQGIIGNPAPT